MDNMLFPALAKKQFNIECNNVIEQERQNLAQREKEIKKDCAQKSLRAIKGRYWLSLILVISLLISLLPTVPMLALMIALIVFLLRNKIKALIGLDKSMQKADEIIEEERRKTEKNIEINKQEYEIRFAEYVKLFEKKAQDLSVNYVESALAVDVINWMTEGFCKTIDSADRRSHIQEINIPFVFRTYRKKIECQFGIYDFEIKRCAELNTPLEQAALSRAIASTVQLNIAMKYPQDATGTDIVINVEYSYSDDCAQTTIVYIAQNGDYKAAQEWK